MLPLQACERLLIAQTAHLPRELADRAPELVGPADSLALPERDRARHSRRGRDEDAVARDLLDPPGGRPEQERLSGARLVDHLLVQLSDAAAAVDEVDPVEAAVGDRAGVRNGQPSRAGATPDDAGRAIPHDPRAELGELVRRVTAREHVEHVLQLRPREVGERIGAAHELVQVVHRDLLLGCDRDDLLREHVERVARDHRLLDPAFEHALDDDRGLEQVGPELGEDAALGDVADVVAGAPDPLQAAGDRLGRLDLQHEVDRAHVDAELETGGGHQARQLARLEHLLDDEALLARQ